MTRPSAVQGSPPNGAMDASFPRVLILSRTEITEFNSQGAALGNWFHDWPRDRLAHMFSAPAGARKPFCGHNYLLTGDERRWGTLFETSKRAALRTRPGGAPTAQSDSMRDLAAGLAAAALRGGKTALLDSGLWEVLFPPRLSSPLLEWVSGFRPDVVFAMVTDIGYMRFAQMLHMRYHLPLCVEVADDWPNTRYRDSALGFAMFPLVDRTFRRLVSRSSICLTIGKEMEREYRERYSGGRFEALMCCDEQPRFLAATPLRSAPSNQTTIVYCGGLPPNRWPSMLDLLRAVETLRAQGNDIGVSVFASEVSTDAKAAFSAFPWVRFAATPPHDEVPAILKGADVLFHCEGFDPKDHAYIRLSVSSKVQLYMLSGVPSLVYGPAGVGVVEYARHDGWAHVVDRRDPAVLQAAIMRLVTDASLRSQIVDRAGRTFEENHDAKIVRERLREVLCLAAAGRPSSALKGDEVQARV